MSVMFDTGQTLPLIVAGVILLVGVTSCIAWLPALRYDHAGMPARIFITAGLIVTVLDAGGLGSVLGLSLTAMGGLVAWEGQPAPEVPRPRRRGLFTAAVITGLATLGILTGWWSFGRIPEEVRAVIALVVAATGVLTTVTVADRARTTLREAISRRFAET